MQINPGRRTASREILSDRRSQAGFGQAALNLERAELETDDQGERRELTAIYAWAAQA